MVRGISAAGSRNLGLGDWQDVDPAANLDPRLLQMLQALLGGQGQPGYSPQDSFEKVGAPKSRGGSDSANPFNMDAQSLLEMAILLLEKLQSEKNSQPAPRPVGSMSSSPQWSGSPQPTSWNGSGSQAPAPTSGADKVAAPVNGLQGDDKKTAEFINKYLADKGSPAADAKSPSAGEMMVDAGKKNGVDPLVLLSIAGQETGFGKLGVGMQKMLGVSAYDNDPSNINPQFDGLRNQIYEGAKTFANLREQGGASEKDDIPTQLASVNKAGWATDPNWHTGVGNWYQDISAAAAKFAPANEGGDTSSVQACAQKLLDSPNVSFWDGLSTGSERKTLEQIAKTGKAFVPATGETVTPSLNMMQALVDMSQKGPIMINALTGGEHSTGSNHYRGLAVDLDLSTGNAQQIEEIANQHGGTRNYETDHIHLDFV